jgi:hypothetical protein
MPMNAENELFNRYHPDFTDIFVLLFFTLYASRSLINFGPNFENPYKALCLIRNLVQSPRLSRCLSRIQVGVGVGVRV